VKNDYYIVSARDGKQGEISQAANLYCAVWREWPWLENDWTKDVVIKEIRAVAQRADMICFFSKLHQELVGFSWGYFVTKEQLRKISGDICLDYIFGDADKVFYVSELGVKMTHRRYGVGADITGKLMESALRKGASVFVLRTDIKAFPARGLYAKLGFIELSIQDQKYQYRTYWLKKIS